MSRLDSLYPSLLHHSAAARPAAPAAAAGGGGGGVNSISIVTSSTTTWFSDVVLPVAREAELLLARGAGGWLTFQGGFRDLVELDAVPRDPPGG